MPKPDARLVRDRASRDASATAQRVSASQITTRKQGSDTVEEYRERGHVWMIRIVPQNGPTQTFMDSDGSGRPYKVHVRAPGFPILSGVPQMIEGKMLADLIPTFDTINMIGGEVEQ